jgi:hypothetical protein
VTDADEDEEVEVDVEVEVVEATLIIWAVVVAELVGAVSEEEVVLSIEDDDVI